MTTNDLCSFDVTPATTATETRRPLASNLYPFLTKAQIKERILTDQAFANHCLLVIHSRQTEAEQARKETISQNRMGFMSSHAVRGTKLANALLANARLNPDDQEMIRDIAKSYSKQLAAHFRAEELVKNPALKAAAQVFGL